MEWAALVISVISAAIAAYALFWNIRYNREEPGWRAVVHAALEGAREGQQELRLTLRNIGDGIGHDVRIASVDGVEMTAKGMRDTRITQVPSGEDTPRFSVLAPNFVDFETASITVEWTRRPTYLGKTGRQRIMLGPAFKDHQAKPPRMGIVIG